MFSALQPSPGLRPPSPAPASEGTGRGGEGAARWICAQIGAREHYAVPRVLRQNGRLASLYTDFWAGSVTRAIARKWKSGSVRSLAGRFHPELEAAKVLSWNVRALLWERRIRRQPKEASASDRYGGYVEVGRQFATLMRDSIEKQQSDFSNAILFSYDTGALEAFAWCRERGAKCILNQMDPSRVEVDLVRTEEKLWPGWATQQTHVPEFFFQRREQEWALANRVVVNSEFSRQALVKQGVAPQKLLVIPLCYEENAEKLKTEKLKSNGGVGVSAFQFSASRPLRILFLGQVILRKGVQYLLKAARKLEQENIHFDIVGPIGISREAVASAPSNVTFHGRAARDETPAWYRKSDVFVLPTLSDGFAITQLEAMAYGLPVVTTPCCGEVVTDGVDGFIVPPSDPDALAGALERYLGAPELLDAQQSAAVAKSRQFTLEHLARHLINLEASLTE